MTYPPSVVISVPAQGPPGPAGADGPIGTNGPHRTVITAGMALSGHRMVTTDSVGNVVYADASNVEHAGKVLGMTTGAASEDGDAIIQTNGVVTEPSWNWDLGELVYLGSDGHLVQTVPESGFVCPVGTPITTTSLLVQISNSVILI